MPPTPPPPTPPPPAPFGYEYDKVGFLRPEAGSPRRAGPLLLCQPTVNRNSSRRLFSIDILLHKEHALSAEHDDPVNYRNAITTITTTAMQNLRLMLKKMELGLSQKKSCGIRKEG